MSRVERVKATTRRTAKTKAPWAKVLIKVGSVYVCYENGDDVPDEHRAMCLNLKDIGGDRGVFDLRVNVGRKRLMDMAAGPVIRCSGCKEWKPRAEFYFSSKNHAEPKSKRGGECKKCNRTRRAKK